MSHKFTAAITKEEKWYVALCIKFGVVSQGKTIEERRLILKKLSNYILKVLVPMIYQKAKEKLCLSEGDVAMLSIHATKPFFKQCFNDVFADINLKKF